MFRAALTRLETHWINKKDRKPLVIRGARQVGKTWLARELAHQTSKYLIELNFERDPQLRSLFEPNNPQKILGNLEVYFGRKIAVTSSILFLDEIQDAPEIMAKLRWFYEEMPELPVIVAGSLLEFILGNHAFSMPVGRITYMHLEPLSFEEFLLACGQEVLLEYIQQITPPFQIPLALHQKLKDFFRYYVFIGGLPASVLSWTKEQSLEEIQSIQQDLLSTYRDDFFKYKGRFDVEKFHKMLQAIPVQLGQKFVYARVDASLQSQAAKQILALLDKARLSCRVRISSGNGVPLGGEVKDRGFKQIFLDVGLANRSLGNTFSLANTVIEGGISEQVVGQMLRCLFPFNVEPSLYYWEREEKGSSAEIDYLIDKDAESNVNNQWVMSIEEAYTLLGR